LESESLQSRRPYDKRDGIIDLLNVEHVFERVVVSVGGVEWTGWTFINDTGSGKDLFLNGGHWVDVDLRKGYAFPPSAIEDWVDMIV